MKLLPLISAKELARLEGMTYTSFIGAYKRWNADFGYPLPVRPGWWCPLAIAQFRENRSNNIQPETLPEPAPTHDLTAKLSNIT